ncbi:MAG: 1-acyl-sn-glycerol-3-phosphate acyltransferase [Rhabdochlamydiaceae bacterium]|nr:1-acyl-sn-glycerol-3-phosphate acyltransferase [Candidatus Amphrikana amoebophyrae]
MIHLLDLISPYKEKKSIPEKVIRNLEGFLQCYEKVALDNNQDLNEVAKMFSTLLMLMEKHFVAPFQFEPYHKAIRSPLDYYQLGISFIKPLINLEKSTLTGIKNLREIDEKVKNGENVVLFANHQIEGDPQVFSILLQDNYPNLAEDKIFVAGERVLTDPLAAPFSMGCNLLCIFSKKYIDNPPEKQHQKTAHNKKTMQLMSELLKEGGHCIYVAPSGGRDRPGKNGKVELAEFDPQSIEMFHLMAKRSKTPTHFYPLSLATYSILPPPETRQIELGEQRITHGGAVHLHFGNEIDMENIPDSANLDKHGKRKMKAKYIFNLVNKAYKNFTVDY